MFWNTFWVRENASKVSYTYNVSSSSIDWKLNADGTYVECDKIAKSPVENRRKKPFQKCILMYYEFAKYSVLMKRYLRKDLKLLNVHPFR